MTDSGEIVLARRIIAKRHIKTRFAMDVTIVGVDWLELIISWILSVGGLTRFGKVTRVFRIVRTVRLLRLARMGDVLGGLLEQFHSERVRLIVDMTRLMVLMLGLAWVPRG